MAAVIELNEKTRQAIKYETGLAAVKLFRISVEKYDSMIEKGILNKYHKVELLDGIIYEKYTGEPYRISAKMYDAMIENAILDENDNVELLDGEIIEKMSKGTKHTAITRIITKFFYRILDENTVIQVQDPIRLKDASEPEPDIILAFPDEKNYAERHPQPKDILLIIEVSDSTLQFDRLNKGLAYSRNGIRQYLIVNVENRTIEDYQNPSEDGYGSKQTYKIGDKFTLLAFPEIEISVADFLQV